jgi:pyroglutamyl-peptidase
MGQSRRTADRNASAALTPAVRRKPHPARRANSREREHTLLLGGFEPFHGERRNPSLEVIRALKDRQIAGLRVSALELPVVYGAAARRMVDAIARTRPAAVLGVGQAGGRPVITLERIAINLLDGSGRDNAGRRATDQPVVVGAPDAYFARLPLREILRALTRQRIPATLSLSAGTFICNAVMYAALHELRRRPAVPCGFIHLPYDTAQGVRHLKEPTMSLELMVAAVSVAIARIGETLNASRS